MQAEPCIRRRYGKILQAGKQRRTGEQSLRYQEYTALNIAVDGSLLEDRSRILYHIIESRASAKAAKALAIDTQSMAPDRSWLGIPQLALQFLPVADRYNPIFQTR